MHPNASLVAVSGHAFSTTKGLAGTNFQAAANVQAATNSVSIRQPSATLAFVVMSQVQFLATLSLVDYTVSNDNLLAGFATGLR